MCLVHAFVELPPHADVDVTLCLACDTIYCLCCSRVCVSAAPRLDEGIGVEQRFPRATQRPESENTCAGGSPSAAALQAHVAQTDKYRVALLAAIDVDGTTDGLETSSSYSDAKVNLDQLDSYRNEVL